MGAASLTCDRCRARLPVSAVNTPDLVACPSCRTPLRFLVFPAFYRAHAPAQVGETIMVEGESSCFYHPAKKAVVPCDGCGRFLCALCDVDLDDKHLCPKCVEAAKTKRTIDTLESERYLYDSMALNFAAIALLLAFCMPYVSVFLAPAAVFVAVRHWNKPRSVVRPDRGRLAAAIIIAVIAFAVAMLFFTAIFGAMFLP